MRHNYLNELVKDLVAPYTPVGTDMLDPTFSPKAEEPEEETQPGEVQTGVGRRD
jgi:hypothetical protein